MKIDLPGIDDQQTCIFEQATKEAIAQLQANLQAPKLAPQTEVDEGAYPRTHLLREQEGWEPPHPDLVGAYFRHFQANFSGYHSDGKLAILLGLSSDRRIREFKQGRRAVPYGVWRTFLVMTGRAPQDVLPVLAYMA
ncbi:hypothetical protein [Pseudomonas arsenicoxydans]|uniref:Uncharacterized protein n=1 Tax=Pseudomonas arsenicoxydans TaxID=702115 RepID=A0A502HSF2_9PSED|nr:hypothetical protein [Pseudomonas arsenicoxydans]TPG76292.1 hypothetical protein EAH78_18175 [Pseudomonas arsenicoxydans]